MEKNGAADSQSDGRATRGPQSESPADLSALSLDDKLAVANRGESKRGPLRNWKHEQFACFVAAGTEPADAYVLSGHARHRANHLRLMRLQRVKDRIDVLRREREMAARAARVPISRVTEELDRRGIIRIEDFFERNAAGIVAVRDLQMVPVEVAVAFLRILSDGFGIGQK